MGAEQVLQGNSALAKAFQKLRHLSHRDIILSIIKHLSASICLWVHAAQLNSHYQLKQRLWFFFHCYNTKTPCCNKELSFKLSSVFTSYSWQKLCRLPCGQLQLCDSGQSNGITNKWTSISPDPGTVWLMPAPRAVVRVQCCAVKQANIVRTFKSSQWLFY